jgi:hypothetical protein
MNPTQEIALKLCWILPLIGATIIAAGMFFWWRYDRYWHGYPENKYK